jgi:cytochrome P450
MLILGAGHDTTTKPIANAVLALLRNPGEPRRLQDDLSLLGSAVEEFLRYDSPCRPPIASPRSIARSPAIRSVAARSWRCCSASPTAIRPDSPTRIRVDIGRLDNHHVSFGHGAHSCLGAALARVEAHIAIATLLRRFADFDGDQHPKDWKRSVILRGPTILWLWW